jgi:hypothetical protein
MSGAAAPAHGEGGTLAWRPGRLVVAPGRGGTALQRERLPGLDAWWRGQPAELFPARAAAIHTLCSHAHRLTAEQALRAARGEPGLLPAERREALRQATLKEQLRRLLHDWPSAMPLSAHESAASLASLRSAPWIEAPEGTAWAAWWLQLLGRPVPAWCAEVQTAGEEGLAAWAEASDTPLARWFAAAARAGAARVALPQAVLRLAQAPSLQRWLAARLATDDGAAFATMPEGPEGPLETGPWARDIDRPPAHAHNAWMRLMGRLLDAVRLGLRDGAARLAHGSLALGAGCGMAWTETARGLLLHWLQLEPAPGGGERLAACRIVSPTDWNFHPRGALGRWLGGPGGEPDAQRDAQWLLLAFDACVPVHWATDEARAGEGAHA